MTETLQNPLRPFGADSPIAHLLDLADQMGEPPTDQEQRDDAEVAAAHHVYNEFGFSLARVLDADDWTGYPAVSDHGTRWQASAVAWLDGGLWLHHTVRIPEVGPGSDILTLVVPCTCGRGYVDYGFKTEDDLLETFAELKATAGRSPHDDKHPLDCTSVTALTHTRSADV
ncbi:hypothetical protein [Streptomyces sp. 039-1]|uniref:hypothetical protein n=1 Tax=Streptomyces sp. 039-1 TaxID=2789263 RepID=UPI0039F5620A